MVEVKIENDLESRNVANCSSTSGTGVIGQVGPANEFLETPEDKSKVLSSSDQSLQRMQSRRSASLVASLRQQSD